jgi:transposase
MIGVAMYTTIETLWKKHQNKALIARLVGHDWKTVAKRVKEIEEGKEYQLKKPHPRILDPYQEEILKWLEEDLSGVRIHEKIQQKGVKVGYSTVKDYLSSIKKREKVFLRIHTLPGEEAQVDFGYVGYTPYRSKRRKTWVFNMRLSYSRLDYYEVVYDQRVETFILCHIHAFAFFGGIPRYIKIDNLKSAILEASFYQPIYQELYRNCAHHYGFQPLPCRVRRPNDKGKVESGIK